MSTAVLESVIEKPVLEKPENLRLVAAAPPSAAPEEKFADPHPLLPVFIIGAISLMLASMFIGSVVAGLLLRNSGLMAQ
ncbi:MAG TPA: hypothetical protein VIB39_12530 [Candidatus Angelobacter sp.]